MIGNPDIDIPFGFYSGAYMVNKYGNNLDVDTGPEDVVSQGGSWTPPTSAVQHNIASTDANDTAAGTGARTIQIWGCDGNGLTATETITMNGTTDVPTVNSYISIWRMRNITAGSNKRNIGTISATAIGGGGAVTAQIPAEKGTTLMAAFTVPNGRGAIIRRIRARILQATAGSRVDMALYAQKTMRVDAVSAANTQIHGGFGLKYLDN